MVRELGDTLGIPMHVFGPESHMTAIVGMALGKRDIPTDIVDSSTTTANFLLAGRIFCCCCQRSYNYKAEKSS